MKKPGVWSAAMLVPAIVGFADSIYLTINVFYEKIPLYCPSSGVINCGLVTTSKYSHAFGIPVAVLGLLWFGVMLGLAITRPSFASYVMFPLWLAGIIVVGYLIGAEVFALHAICLYCTLAHVCTAVMGIPIIKLTLSDL